MNLNQLGREALQEIAAIVKIYDECEDYDGFYIDCGESIERMRQLLSRYPASIL
jgi:hypothetical protein